MKKYLMIRTHKSNEEGEYETYGIAYVGEECPEIIIDDISTDKELAKAIVEKCNDYNAAPEHIFDIVYDNIL